MKIYTMTLTFKLVNVFGMSEGHYTSFRIYASFIVNWGVCMRKKTIRSSAVIEKDIKRCYNCKDGRIMRHKNLIFCGFCGKEFKRLRF